MSFGGVGENIVSKATQFLN